MVAASGGALDLGTAMAELDRWLPATAVVTVDAGNFSGWPQRYLTFGGGRRLIGATNGAMGYGVPAAVAAKIAAPERTVIACAGDGGFGMTGQELATAVKHRAAPILLVFNNAMYGTIRMHQERKYPARVIATDLANPDFAALARAYGAHGETVTRTGEFVPALDRAAASGTAAVVELRMDPDAITTRTTLSAIRRSAAAAEPG
jgi:acetolactate synthase-1/2/3 large subunit